MSVSARGRKTCERCGKSKAWSRKAFSMHQKTCTGEAPVSKTVLDAFLHVDRFEGLTKREFEKIVAAYGVGEDDERLVSMLIDRGWKFLVHMGEDEECYVREPVDPKDKRLSAIEVLEREIREARVVIAESDRNTIRMLRGLLARMRWAAKKRLILK
jgi:hypothetical protein